MLLGGGIVGAILFYLITNTAAWMTLEYPKDAGGKVDSGRDDCVTRASANVAIFPQTINEPGGCLRGCLWGR